MVGNGKLRSRVLAKIQEYLTDLETASAREIASHINLSCGRGVTVAQVSNFLAAYIRFRKVRSVGIVTGERGDAIWLWEMA